MLEILAVFAMVLDRDKDMGRRVPKPIGNIPMHVMCST